MEPDPGTSMTTEPAPPAFNRSADSLERLFRDEHERVFRVAWRVTGNALDAEDVLQTIFLRLARRPNLDELGPTPGAYLARAAVNAALDLVRARGLRSIEPLDEAAAELADHRSRGPEGDMASTQLRDRLRKALGTLSPKAAEIFVLRHFEGYGNGEIARMTGSSAATVAVQLFRAKSRLQKELSRSTREGE